MNERPATECSRLVQRQSGKRGRRRWTASTSGRLTCPTTMTVIAVLPLRFSEQSLRRSKPTILPFSALTLLVACKNRPLSDLSHHKGKGTETGRVLSRCLKTASDGADATWRGRSFQTVAPETGNARLPTVERRTGGTSR